MTPYRMRAADWAQIGILSVAWASSYLLFRLLAPSLPPVTVALARVGLGALCLHALLALRGHTLRRPPGGWRSYLWMGLLNNAFPFSVIVWAEHEVTAGLTTLLAVFARWKANEVRVSVDDEIRGGRMHDVVVANGRYFGGGMMICPEASSDDGLLDVLLIGDLTKRDLLLTLPKTYRGRHLPHPKAESLRGRVVTIDAPEPLPVELDGEQPGRTPARFEIVPRALRLRVPGDG